MYSLIQYSTEIIEFFKFQLYNLCHHITYTIMGTSDLGESSPKFKLSLIVIIAQEATCTYPDSSSRKLLDFIKALICRTKKALDLQTFESNQKNLFALSYNVHKVSYITTLNIILVKSPNFTKCQIKQTHTKNTHEQN